jgi:uncharacterized protein YndB with AHSA1/START domain
MAAQTVLVVERHFREPREVLFNAWTEPAEMAQWRGSPGWHVERETVRADLRLGGTYRHVKVRDDDPSVRVTTDAIFTEIFIPTVLVARQRISGDNRINPNTALELRVEFLRSRRQGTLVRIVQGPYDETVAGHHSRDWECELSRLETYLARRGRTEG